MTARKRPPALLGIEKRDDGSARYVWPLAAETPRRGRRKRPRKAEVLPFPERPKDGTRGPRR